MPQPKQIESYINDATLKDLVAAYLVSIGVIRYNEDITDLALSLPDKEGIRKMQYRIEPNIQTIEH